MDVAAVESFEPALARLAEQRLTATEDRIEADLRLGRAPDVITELTTLVAEHPLRERLVGILMRALSQAGRPADALAVYERARTALADELGTYPSPDLSNLHTAVLRGEIGPTPTTAVDDTVRRTNLRAGLTSFVGRDADVAQVRDLLARVSAHHPHRSRRIGQDSTGCRVIAHAAERDA